MVHFQRQRINSFENLQYKIFQTSIVNYKILKQRIKSMQIKKQEKDQKRQYSRITLKIKATLIRLIFRKAVSLDSAIQQLSLKKTTALNIIKHYKETGSLPMRKFKRVRKMRAEIIGIKKEEVLQNLQPAMVYSDNENASINPLIPTNPFAYQPIPFGWYGFPLSYYSCF